jgi:predicted PurR-regulated permease PerM
MATLKSAAPDAGRVVAPAVPGSAVELAVLGFMIVAALYFGQAVFVPLALAVILSFILALPVRVLRRIGVSNGPAVFLVVVFAFGCIFGIGALITQQVASLTQEIPRYQLVLKDKVKSLKDATSGRGGAIERASETLKDLRQELDKPSDGATSDAPQAAPTPRSPFGAPIEGPAKRPVPVEVHAPAATPLDQMQSVIGVIIAPLATAGVVILFVVFLLLQRVDVRDRAIRLLGSHDLEKSTAAMDDAGHRLSQYFLTFTAINAAYGVLIGGALWLIGVPSPMLWGVLAMLMRFVPFVGSFIAAILPLVLAAAVDQGWTMFGETLALFVVGELVMGNMIEPVVQGNRTGLSPLAIILSAAFWTLLWGPIGLILAIPLTVVLVVLGRHVERLGFLHVLLGDAPPLEPPERFYQRMLAGDPAEAVEQAEKMLKTVPLVTYYDDVVIEGLRLAQADADRGTLELERLPELHETAEVVIDTLSDYDLLPKKKKKGKAATEESEAANDTGSLIDPTEEDDEEDDEYDAADLIAPEFIPPEWQSENAIVCVASRTALDETAALILAQLLTKCGLGAKVLGPIEVKHGALRSLNLDGARLVCISALDVRERSAHVRFLVRRLRRSAPNATLLGGFWKLDPEDASDKTIIDSVAVDAVAPSIRDALGFCLQAARAANSDEADHDASEAAAAS